MPWPVRRPSRRGLAALALFLLVVAGASLVAADGSGRARAVDTGPAGAPVVAVIGDSWTVGAGAAEGHGFVVRTADRLGWGYRPLGVNGSGYSVPGPHDDVFAERVEAVAGADVVVVQGSLNERRSSPEALAPAALQTLARLRAAVDPGTPVLVVGASYNPGTPDATIDWINDALAAAARRTGLPFVDPSDQGWTDPGDPGVWADPIHPNDRGHQQIAEHLAPLVRDLRYG